MHFLIVYVKPIGMIDTQSCYTSLYKSIQVCTSLYNSLNLQPYTMYINNLKLCDFWKHATADRNAGSICLREAVHVTTSCQPKLARRCACNCERVQL